MNRMWGSWGAVQPDRRPESSCLRVHEMDANATASRRRSRPRRPPSLRTRTPRRPSFRYAELRAISTPDDGNIPPRERRWASDFGQFVPEATVAS
jgi:hypothetical protein